MYDDVTRERVLRRLADGISLNRLSAEVGVSRATIREWRDARDRPIRTTCPRCGTFTGFDRPAYAHLLGLYLGDGCLSAMPKGVFSLRISCDAKYPLVFDEAAASIARVKPGAKVHKVRAPGAIVVQCLWKHWPCLFTQHGAGRKHLRQISLDRWQQEIVDDFPKPLLRGLFHSDGCRITNWTVRRLRAGPKRYEYPRYLFSNESADIMEICTNALDQLGMGWSMPRRNMLSVARRGDVATLDTFIGPKS